MPSTGKCPAEYDITPNDSPSPTRHILRSALYFIYPNAKFRVNKHETCSICLSPSTDSALQCGHGFHWDCVREWLDSNNTCPICRARQCRWIEPVVVR